MCFGGGSSKAPKADPPTVFQYGPADYSNSQRQVSASEGGSTAAQQASYGAELSGAATTTGTSNTGAM